MEAANEGPALPRPAIGAVERPQLAIGRRFTFYSWQGEYLIFWPLTIMCVFYCRGEACSARAFLPASNLCFFIDRGLFKACFLPRPVLHICMSR